MDNLVARYIRYVFSTKTHREKVPDEWSSLIHSRNQTRFGVDAAGNGILDLAIHPTGQLVAYSRSDGSLTVWALGSGHLYSRGRRINVDEPADGKGKVVTSVAWNPLTRSEFVTANNTCNLFLWGVEESARRVDRLRTIALHNHRAKVVDVKYDPHGQWLLATTKNECIYIFDTSNDYSLKSSIALSEICPDSDTLLCTAFSNNGNLLFLGFKSGVMAVLHHDNSDLRLIYKSAIHRGAINCLKVDPNGNLLVSASEDGSCIMMRMSDLLPLRSINDLGSEVTTLDICDYGKLLFVGTSDGSLRFYDLNSNICSHIVEPLQGKATHLIFKFHPSKPYFMVSGADDILESYTTPYRNLLDFLKKSSELPKHPAKDRLKNNVSWKRSRGNKERIDKPRFSERRSQKSRS